MKTHSIARSPIRSMALAAVLAFGLASSSLAVNVSISGITQARNQAIIDFIQTSFVGVTVTYGDFSNPATIPVGTDILMVGRVLSSGAYDNAVNSATFNGLSIPVVSFTSFVTRTTGNRWSWESGPNAGGGSVVGNETTVTAAGAGLFGAAGTFDWWTVTDAGSGFNSAGTGTVGTGNILATIGGNNLVAGWHAGDTSAGGVVFTANRLLFNLPDSDPNTGNGVVPDTAAGRQAFISALSAYTGLVPVPEPSSIALLGVGALAAVFMIRRRVS